MRGGFNTNQGTLDAKTLSNDKDVFANMTYALLWDVTVGTVKLTELPWQVLQLTPTELHSITTK